MWIDAIFSNQRNAPHHTGANVFAIWEFDFLSDESVCSIPILHSSYRHDRQTSLCGASDFIFVPFLAALSNVGRTRESRCRPVPRWHVAYVGRLSDGGWSQSVNLEPKRPRYRPMVLPPAPHTSLPNARTAAHTLKGENGRDSIKACDDGGSG